MWQSVFDKMLKRLFRQGQLKVTFPDGRSRIYGEGGELSAAVTIRDDATLRALCLRPDLALGEGYMDGRIVIEGDDIDSLLRMALRNSYQNALPFWPRLVAHMRYRLGNFLQRNTPSSARANVAHHYDLSNELYRLFLDEDMQYSCAYFTDPTMTLEAAQAAKKAHIGAKLRIKPGMRVLDIGCGWGGMAMTLARDFGANVVGVTLSQNQLKLAQERVAAAGLEDRIDLRLIDYRLLDEPFDRIVSVGMLEHVGLPHYDDYFGKVAELLDPDGVALIHTIGRTGLPMAQSEWILRYIFPGGYVPSLSQLSPAIERSGLWTCDIEVLRLHYALTLRHWLARFDARLDTVRQTHDERFIRMWRYYLTVCYLAFEEQAQAVFQFQLTKKRDAVPLTRDYLYPARATESAEARRPHAAE